MYDENQLVEMKCHPKTRKHYESKGYKYTKMGDAFLVKAKDLTPGSNVRIEVICDFCGEPYYPFVYNYNNRKNKDFDACDNCRTRKGSNTTLGRRAKEHFDKIRQVCEENDYILLTDESEYRDLNTPIIYECKKHGIKQSNAGLLLQGRGCRDCGYETVVQKRTLDKQYVKNETEKFNGNKLLNPDDYIGARVRNLKILCSCGEIFITSFNDYMSKDAKRCPSCSGHESSGEYAVKQILNKYNISFVQQKKFSDCRDTLPLPFDFYLPDYNMVIEYNGRQHYEAVDYFGGQDAFEYTAKHDSMKDTYCKDNNIHMLRISYADYKNTEHIITKELNIDL